MLSLQEKIISDTGGSSTVTIFLNNYRKIQQERYENGEIKLNTLKQKAAPLRVFDERFGTRPLDAITVKDVYQYWKSTRPEDITEWDKFSGKY